MFIVPFEVIASYESLSYFRIAAVNREMEENCEKAESQRASASKTMEGIWGAVSRPRYRMRLHSKKDPQVNDEEDLWILN